MAAVTPLVVEIRALCAPSATRLPERVRLDDLVRVGREAADRLVTLEDFAVAAGEAMRSLIVQVGTLTAYNEALIREMNDLTAEALMKRAS